MLALLLSLLLSSGLAIPSPQEPTQQFGAAVSSPTLQAIDQLVRSHGIDRRFRRDVTWKRGVRSTKSPKTGVAGEFAVVNYRKDDSGEISGGVQVWIDRRSKDAIVVPNTQVRTAQILAVQSGHDLSQYSWIVERIGNDHHFTFWWRPREVDGYPDGGTFTIVLDARTGKKARSIIYQP